MLGKQQELPITSRAVLPDYLINIKLSMGNDLIINGYVERIIMCLSLIVTLPQAKQKDADFIAEESSTNEMKAYKEKRLFGKASRYLFVASKVGNCACDLLTDNADWNAETWDIIPSYLPHISSVITNLYQHLPEGFLFEALWAGDKPGVKKEVSITELARLIQNNTIETKTIYQITSADGEKRGGLTG